MKSMLPKIGIFAGMIVIQLVLAYVLVNVILPPTRLTNVNTAIANADSPTETKQVADSSHAVFDSTSAEYKIHQEISNYLDESSKEIDPTNSTTFTLDGLVVNPAGSMGTRYLVMTLHLLLEGAELDDLFLAMRPALSDAIISLLSRRSTAWLCDADNRAFLREEIKRISQRILGDTPVLQVYFSKFLFQ